MAAIGLARSAAFPVLALLFSVLSHAHPAATPKVARPDRPSSSKSVTWELRGKVTAPDGQPIAGAKVTFHLPDQTAAGAPIETDLLGAFHARVSFALPEGVPTDSGLPFALLVMVTKQGYRRAWELVRGTSSDAGDDLLLVLQDDERRAVLLMPASLLQALAARFTKAERLQPFAPAAREDCTRGAKKFATPGHLAEAMQLLERARSSDPACFGCQLLLGLGHFEAGGWGQAERLLVAAAGLDGSGTVANRRPEPLVVLAVKRMWEDHSAEAEQYLRVALEFDPSNPLALQELGRLLMFRRDLAEAERCLNEAAKNGAPPEVHLVRSSLYLMQRDFRKARREFNRYQAKRYPIAVARAYPSYRPPVHPGAMRVWQDLRTYSHLMRYGKPESVVTRPLKKLVAEIQELREIQPAPSQEELPSLLKQAGNVVERFLTRFPNTISDEQVVQEELSRSRGVKETHESQYQYLVVIRPGWVRNFVTVYRTDEQGNRLPDNSTGGGLMLDKTATMYSVLFLPSNQAGTDFRLLGRQFIRGRETRVIAFAQRPLESKVTWQTMSRTGPIPYLLQGIAWIDTHTHQIVLLRADLLKPLKEIDLKRTTVTIEYGEAKVEGAPGTYWLPLRVTVLAELGRDAFRNQYSYSNFRLFNVQSTIRTDLKELE